MKRHFKLAVGVLLSMMILLLAGCSGQDKKQANNSEEELKAPIKVAAMVPLSGPFAAVGKDIATTIEIALKDFNSNSKVSIELVLEDAGSENTTAKNAVNKLMTVKPSGMLNMVLAPQFGSVNPVLEKEKIPTVIFSSNPAVYENGWNWIFGTMPAGNVENVAAVKFLKEKLGKSRIALFVPNDNVGTSALDVINSVAGKMGITVIPSQYQPGDNDFSGNIVGARRNNPDAFLVYSTPGDGAKIIRQLKQAGVKETIIGNVVPSMSFLDLFEGNESEGLYGWAASVPTISTDPQVKKFSEKFKAITGRAADHVAVHVYDGAMMLFDAAVKGGGDPQKAIGYMHDIIDYNGLAGKYTYDDKGRGRKDTNIVKIGPNKEITIVEHVEVAID